MSKERLEKLLIELDNTKITNYEKIAYFKKELAYIDSPSQKFELKEKIKTAEKEIQDIDIRIDSLHGEIRDLDARLQSPKIHPDQIQHGGDFPYILEICQKETDSTKQSNTTKEINKNEIENIKPISKLVIHEQIKGNYTSLRELLVNHQWKEADLETTQIILQVAKRQKEGWLKSENIANFSCSDILIIDQLWLDASRGQFGFSVQRNIWLSVDGKPGKFERAIFDDFSNQVGWRINKSWLRNFEGLNFSLDAPKGHLPSFRFPAAIDQFVTWQESFKHFLPRIETCFSGDT